MSVDRREYPTTALVVCGGRGSRLGPLGEVINKSLLPVQGMPMAAAVVRSLHRTFGCKEYVFLGGYLEWQLERVLPRYLEGLSLEFVEDQKQCGTANAVWAVLMERGLSEFIYSHANVLVGEGSLTRVAESAVAGSALTVSADSQAGTHPRVRVGEGSRVQGIADPRASFRSVGLAVFRETSVTTVFERPGPGVSVEEMMLEALPTATVKAVDVGADWRHLEDLSFYL